MGVGMLASLTMGLRGPFCRNLGSHDGGDDVSNRRHMILAFHRVQAEKRRRSGAFVSTWVLVAAYMLVWKLLAGVAAYAGAIAVEAVVVGAALSPTTAARIGRAVLVATGLYQLTPLKRSGTNPISSFGCARPSPTTSAT